MRSFLTSRSTSETSERAHTKLEEVFVYDEGIISSGCNYKVKSACISDAVFNRRLQFDQSKKKKERTTALNKTYDVKPATVHKGTKILKGSLFRLTAIICLLSLVTSPNFALHEVHYFIV